jgi:hypothetical protein
MKYDVHVYAVVRIKIPIEANDQKDAIKKVMEQTEFNKMFDRCESPEVEYADDVIDFLVDEPPNAEGDVDYSKSKNWHYDGDGELVEGRK